MYALVTQSLTMKTTPISITLPVPPTAGLLTLAAVASPQSAKAIKKVALKKFLKEVEKHRLDIWVRHQRNIRTLRAWKRDFSQLSPEAQRAQILELEKIARESDNIVEIRKEGDKLETGACKEYQYWMAFMKLVGYDRFFACIGGA